MSEFECKQCKVPQPESEFYKKGFGGRATKCKSCTLDVHWDSIKHIVMYNLLSQKFSKEPFKSLLLSTGDEEICEGNYWHDNFWGNCSCSKCSCIEGKNVLGKLLMQVRKELR